MSRKFVKVIIIGDFGIGKTSLLSRFVDKEFKEASTKKNIGSDFKEKTIIVNDQRIDLQIWDTSGAEQHDSLGGFYYKRANACLIVYDVTKPKTFENIDKWYKNFIQETGIKEEEISKYPLFLVGSKNDLTEDKKVTTEQGQEWANKKGAKFMEISSKNDQNITELFELVAEKSYDKNEDVEIPDTIGLEDEPNVDKKCKC